MHLLFIQLNPKSKKPLYLQLHDFLFEEIVSGRVREGEKLPGRRTAADMLGLSLKTVDTAYQLLAAEGYVEAKAGSGFRVCKIEQLPPPVPSSGMTISGESERDGRVQTDKAPLSYSFMTSDVDAALFPFKTWARLFKDNLYSRPDLLNHGHPKGDGELRSAVSLYLTRARGVVCSPDRIIIGAGMEYLLGLLCRLLNVKNVAVEDPGYPKIHQIMRANGMEASFVPVDGEGIIPEALMSSEAQAVYLTPSHQFPTGAVLPAGRRSRVLKWALENDKYIIEDDYDSEFRFDGRPMPCMQAFDPERVIYIGTFSRTIAPAIRVAYMVLPEKLIARYDESFGFFSSTVSRFEQQTLFRYMDEGHFGRGLTRARNSYRLRRDRLVGELKNVFGNDCAVENAHTGLSFLFLPKTGRSEEEICRRAEEIGLGVRGLDSYRFINDKATHPPALVLGFGGLDEKSIPTAVEMLAEAVK